MNHLIERATLRMTCLLIMLSQADSGFSAETYLGISARRPASAVRAALNLPRDAGLSIQAIITNSPAEKATLQANDIITRLDDQWLFSCQQLAALVRSQSPGDKVALSILRQEEPQTIEVSLEARLVTPAETGGPRVLTIPFDQWDDPADLVLALQDFTSNREEVSSTEAEEPVSEDEVVPTPEPMTSWTELMEAIEEEAELVAILKRAPPTNLEPAPPPEPSAVLVAPPNPADDPAAVYSIAGRDLVITIDEVGGSREATITTPSGALVFRGFIDAEADRTRVPRGLRRRVTELLDSPTWTPKTIEAQDAIEMQVLELRPEVI
jgi:hypothetical protein